MPSDYKYTRLLQRLIDGEDVGEEFARFLALDGDAGAERFRELLFATFRRQGTDVTDRISVAALKRVNDAVKRNVPIEG